MKDLTPISQVKDEIISFLEKADGFFVHQLFVEDDLFYFFWSETPEMPDFPVPNKSWQRQVETWKFLPGEKMHKAERFDTRREMYKKLFELRSLRIRSFPLI